MQDPSRESEFESEALVHLDALYKTAHRLTGSPEEAEEVVDGAVELHVSLHLIDL